MGPTKVHSFALSGPITDALCPLSCSCMAALLRRELATRRPQGLGTCRSLRLQHSFQVVHTAPSPLTCPTFDETSLVPGSCTFHTRPLPRVISGELPSPPLKNGPCGLRLPYLPSPLECQLHAGREFSHFCSLQQPRTQNRARRIHGIMAWPLRTSHSPRPWAFLPVSPVTGDFTLQ